MLQAGCNGMQAGALGDTVMWALARKSPEEVDTGSGQRKCLERAAYGPPFFVVRQAWREAPLRRYPVNRGGWRDDLGVKVPYGPW